GVLTWAGFDSRRWRASAQRRYSFASGVARAGVGTEASRARPPGTRRKTTPARRQSTAGSRALSSATTATRLAATSVSVSRATAQTAAPAERRAAAARPVAPAYA